MWIVDWLSRLHQEALEGMQWCLAAWVSEHVRVVRRVVIAGGEYRHLSCGD